MRIIFHDKTSIVLKYISIPKNAIESSVGNNRKIKSYEVEDNFYETLAIHLI